MDEKLIEIGKKLRKYDWDSVIRDYQNGMRCPEIAKKYGMHLQTAHRIIRVSGTKRPITI